jgi:tetratricopeptide (TPR) repeat protein
MWRKSVFTNLSRHFMRSNRGTNIINVRNFASKKNKRRSLEKRLILNIQERPEGEKPYESKYPLPDVDKEKELGRMQDKINEDYRMGNYSAALKASQDFLEDTRNHFTENHPATASAYNNVGLMHKQCGNFDESRKNYQTALDIYKAIVGHDHQSTASVLHNLGTLYRVQMELELDLKPSDRMALLEESISLLEQAFSIRLEEMGAVHPHTVASRSGWGSSLCSQILHYSRASEKAKAYMRAPDDISSLGWDAAVDHMRQALQTAVDHPRGTSLYKKRDFDKHKNEVHTLSAASAAQNLAVCLKLRATSKDKTEDEKELFEEAHELYQQALKVRSKLLPEMHPDLVATKHSLAELLHAMGDEEGANALRSQILDAYDRTTTEAKQKQ